ncbi:MAG: LysM domain-containing protein [Tissierellia bacterium]|nr:LysM domain-containing protein [Tissierellia bacterium]
MKTKLLKICKFDLRPLTNKERLLLTLLGIVLVIYLSNSLLLTPQAEKISELETLKVELDTKIVDMNNTLKKEDAIKKELEMLHRERNEVFQNYFPVLDQAQIIYLLNDLIVDDRVYISDMNFNEPNEETIGEINVHQMSITIPLEGSYNGIVSVVESIGTSPRRIVVDSLSMDRINDSELSGSMSLKVYSLEGIAETNTKIINIETAQATGDGSLFDSFKGYNVYETGDYGLENSTAIDDGDYTKVMLHDFESANYSFIPSNRNIKGDTIPSTISKSGKYSLRFEYNMLALDEENRAYIDLGINEIELKYPPNIISMWVNAFGYSPGTLGMRLRTQAGEDIDTVVSEGISWLGWSNIETIPPQDLSLYPLKLTHLYFELSYNKDDFGVLLIDKLEVYYPINEDSSANNQPINDFYIVQPGDTASSISKKIYGTESYKNEIMKYNNLTTGDVLPVGKVLVLVRR